MIQNLAPSTVMWRQCDIRTHCLAVLLVSFMAVSCQAKKVPKVIKSLNKALGLSSKSKVVWDILSIDDVINEVENNTKVIDDVINDVENNTKVSYNKFIEI